MKNIDWTSVIIVTLMVTGLVVLLLRVSDCNQEITADRHKAIVSCVQSGHNPEECARGVGP